MVLKKLIKQNDLSKAKIDHPVYALYSDTQSSMNSKIIRK